MVVVSGLITTQPRSVCYVRKSQNSNSSFFVHVAVYCHGGRSRLCGLSLLAFHRELEREPRWPTTAGRRNHDGH